MDPATIQPHDQLLDCRVLLLPQVSDGAADIARALETEKIVTHTCSTPCELCEQTGKGAGAVIVWDKPIVADPQSLIDCVASQPIWSDLPVIVLARAGPRTPQLTALLPKLGNVSVLEDGLSPAGIAAVARLALRSRGRQYGVRDEFEAQSKARESLRDDAARSRELADAFPHFVWVAGADGRQEYSNRRWRDYVGDVADSKRQWLSAVHPDDLTETQKRWTRSLESGQPLEAECRLRSDAGPYRWFLCRALPIHDKRDSIVRWFGAFTDISAQKEAQASLQRMLKQTEMVVQGARVGVWHCPLPFDVLMWDAVVKEHFHLAPDAPVTIDTFYERIHPDDRERTRTTIDASIREKRQYEIDYRTVSADGERTHWIHAVGRGFYDDAGSPIGFDGITLDVTERVLAEDRVREKSKIIDTINQVGRSVAAELNLEKVVQGVVDATTIISGAQFGAFFYNVVDEQGESYSLYAISGVDRSHFEKFPMPRNTDIFRPTFEGRGTVRLDDVTLDPRYGRHAPYHGMPAGHLPVRSYMAIPVVSRAGQVLGGLFFGHSAPGLFTARAEEIVAGISAQAAVAIDNARLYEAANRANAQKDELLTRERAARGEIERASQMKDEFLATLSHELRTPLNAILGWAQILRTIDAPSLDEIREGIEIIERNARVQTQIIEDLLDMSRIISGKIRLDVQRLDLRNVVRAAVETIRPAADAKGVRIQSVLDPQTVSVSGDPNRLQQVLWNLLSNAVKFTPRGGRVQVLLERVNSHLEISVIDTGEGIPAHFLPHAFDRFRQADASTTRSHGGLGLGLSIVKQLVELHGGCVSVKSAGPGQGSTFIVALPLVAIDTEPDRKHPAAPGKLPGVDDLCLEIAGVRVLIVDDEPDARALVKRILEACKAIVVTAGSAEEAMEHLAQNVPDVLISDIGMPGEDGYSLIKRLRALPPAAGGQIPAIALTAYARAEDRIKAMLAGFQQHLVKPVEPVELLTLVSILANRVKT